MNQVKFVERQAPKEATKSLEQAGIPTLVARLLAGRGVCDASEVDPAMGKLLKPGDLKGAKEAGGLLATAIQEGRRVTVVADYDCDGASACAIMLRGMRLLGAKPGTVSYLVPDRQRDGYGLSPVIVDRAIDLHNPHVLVTVDNGIASIEGVDRGIAAGLQVIVTDHHLPAVRDGEVILPEASVIVNPCQPDCSFGSKSLCGAGVAFYTMLMTRSALRERGVFDAHTQPRLDGLMDLVALATVADVVKLDENNRRLIAHGLDRIRSDFGNPGIKALFAVAGRSHQHATSTDLGFTVGPRINAAGRLSDMTIGIECLLTDDRDRATQLAGELHRINQERRQVESSMVDEAETKIATRDVSDNVIVVFDEGFHEGVVGIVAGKIKEAEHKPTFVFARAQSGDLKGSGRSIAGFHLRDALDLVSKRHPELIIKFGGHAMAAGCTIVPGGLADFQAAFAEVAREWLTQDMLDRVVMTDGPMASDSYCIATIEALNEQVWGQGFEEPIFVDKAQVLEQRLVGSKNLKLLVCVDGQRREAIWFGRTEPLDKNVELAYRVGLNEWQGKTSVQMLVKDVLRPSPEQQVHHRT